MKKKLLALFLSIISNFAQADNYNITNDDISGQSLLSRWASNEGKLIRWYASDYLYFDNNDKAKLNLQLKNANSLNEAIIVLINIGNKKLEKFDKMPLKTCIFTSGDIVAVVFNLDHVGCN